MNDISNFGRSIKLQAHFKNNQPADKNDEIIRFRPKPDKKWTPTKTHQTVNTFVESLKTKSKTNYLKQLDVKPKRTSTGMNSPHSKTYKREKTSSS